MLLFDASPQKFQLLFFFLILFNLLIIVSFLPPFPVSYNRQISKIPRHDQGISEKITLFVDLIEKSPIFRNSKFSQYRNESIRYYGNQDRMHSLFKRLFNTKEPSLKIAIFGGSNSVPRKVQVN